MAQRLRGERVKQAGGNMCSGKAEREVTEAMTAGNRVLKEQERVAGNGQAANGNVTCLWKSGRENV